MKILIDMNLSPDWCRWLAERGIQAVHWSTVGDPKAPDTEVLSWARVNGHIVLTHDLDFGAILAATGALSPSVVLLRIDDVVSVGAGPLIASILTTHEQLLLEGALLCVEPARSRIRVLPLRKT